MDTECKCFPDNQEVVHMMREAVSKLLQPDRWNYMILGNAVPHVHLHMIPRYANPREILGWKFEDRHWGKLHSRQDRPPTAVFDWLLAEIRDLLGATSD